MGTVYQDAPLIQSPGKALDSRASVQENPHLACLVKDLLVLYNNQESTDSVFVVGKDKVELFAHRAILWARCHNFKRYHQQFWRSSPSQGRISFTYEHYDPGLFRQVLEYIYTGQMALRDASVFSVIVMAKDFGLPELLTMAESYVLRKLSVENACLFLNAALHLEKLNKDPSDKEFSEVCYRFIKQHAEACVTTEPWLELPKQAIIRLVSSQEFSLEEDKVWLAVLSWAKYNAGIPLDKIPSSWNDHERTLIAEVLEGVTEHIKLFLIDSHVFAQDVEPTGLVPMETILERYRFAAVASPKVSEDHRMRPRVSQQLFRDSAIITEQYHHFQSLLNQWYGVKKQEWTLLYRASHNGYTADAFHQCCDGHAPTFTLVKGTNGSICGGFSDVPWLSKTPPRGRYIPSHRAFLFTLVNHQDVAPTKYDISNSVLATLHHPKFGPIFGGGADLCIADNCNVGMECYSNFPHSYCRDDNSSCSSVLMGDYNFNVSDYEVFTVKQEMV